MGANSTLNTKHSKLSSPCPHYPHCVGCTLIGKPYGEQLRIKRERVQNAFRPFASLNTLDIPEVVRSPHSFGYRNQAKLVARRARGGLLLGIYRPGSHQVADIRQCPVHHALIAELLEPLAAGIEKFGIPIYDERSAEGALRYVLLRASTWAKSVQIVLVTRIGNVANLRPLARQLAKLRGVVSVVQNVNPDPGNVILGPEFIPLAGTAALIERVGDLKLKSHAGAFLQANIGVARKLYADALRQAAPNADAFVIDLYCGIGALTFHLAAEAGHVFGIEESPIAIADAKENTRLNGFHNVRFYCGDTATRLPPLAAQLPRVDVITLNPPRKGADVQSRDAIVACVPRRIVYVSCDPDTLGRDLEWFAGRGYNTIRVQPFDMLPQTEHIECVATLTSHQKSDPVAPFPASDGGN